jgi:hypothetical protein
MTLREPFRRINRANNVYMARLGRSSVQAQKISQLNIGIKTKETKIKKITKELILLGEGVDSEKAKRVIKRKKEEVRRIKFLISEAIKESEAIVKSLQRASKALGGSDYAKSASLSQKMVNYRALKKIYEEKLKALEKE